MRKFLSIMLTVAIIFSCVSYSASAVSGAETNNIEITEDELSQAETEEDKTIADYSKSLNMLKSTNSSSDLVSVNGFWKYRIIDDECAEITDYLGNNSSIVIPENIDGYKITKISAAAFFNRTGLTDISIPSTVEEIGWWAFYGCTGLKNIYLNEGLKTICYGAFMNCSELKSVSVPMSIDKIGADCFVYSCKTTVDVTDSTSGKKISTQNYTKKSDFVISGYSGTYAQKYAKDENIKFTSKGTVKFGDVNCDGKLSESDTVLLDKYIKGTVSFSSIQKRNADVDYNGKINSTDTSIIKKCISNDYSLKAMPAVKSQYLSENYLYGKSIYCDGDSIARGTGTNILGNSYYSYCNFIADANNMKLTQKAVPGTTLAVQDDKTGNDKSITERVLEMKGKYDFILLEGGYNDLFQNIPVGTVTDSNNKSGNYDKYTTAGAVETICYFLKKNYSDTPTLFIVCQQRNDLSNTSAYWNVIKSALKKWNIPYIDISEETEFSNINETISNQYFRYTEKDGKGDGTHPLKYAHEKIFTPIIQEKMNNIISEKETVSAEDSSVILGKGESYKISAKSDCSNINLSCRWTSGNPSVVSVKEDGTATANTTGTAELKLCSQNNRVAKCKVTVKSAPSSIKLSLSSLTLGNGESYIISESTNSGSYAKNFTWSSSNTSVATVEKTEKNKAKITAKGNGTATITVRTYNEKTATCKVTVKSAPSSIQLSTNSLMLGIGESFEISECTNSGSYAKNFTWSSSNTNVATVEKTVANKAKITAKNNGSATITVKTYNGKTATCKITVKNAPKSVNLSVDNVILGKGEAITIYQYSESNSYARNFTWSSSNTSVATVEKTVANKAKITAKNNGTATITIKTYNGKTATCKVTVKNAPSSVALSAQNVTLNAGSEYIISESTNNGSYANAGNLQWSSSNASVATVTKTTGNKAKITAKKSGTAVITIKTYNGKTATCKITVK
ncbi:MAG: Ig-like domain-containing protein [Ruminococcus sp.]